MSSLTMISVIIAFYFNGCTQSIETAIIQPQKIASITIIEEKTTKQEFLKTLWNQSNADSFYLTYTPTFSLCDKTVYYVITYVQKDGTTFKTNVCRFVSMFNNYKTFLLIDFGIPIFENTKDLNEEHHIVTTVSFGD